MGRKTDLIDFQIKHYFQWGCRALTGTSEGVDQREKKGGEDKKEPPVNINGEGKKNQGVGERVRFTRRGCVQRIRGEKDGEEGNVNGVTHLLISNELRLRVFNENV